MDQPAKLLEILAHVENTMIEENKVENNVGSDQS